MTPKLLPVLLLWPVVFSVSPSANMARDAAPPARANIYNESADGAKQIADALVLAKQKQKRVLLQFGANWCSWCHKLHRLFETDKTIAAVLQSDFVVVMIDVNKGHNKEVDAKLGQPTRHGLPVLVVLDAAGKQLVTQETGSLEEGDHHSPQKVIAFLKKWSVPRDSQ
jgi:thioredoxin-related protein